MMGTGDVALACMSILVDELVRRGVRHACVSPGSRSTPIALALDRHPDVTVHVHLDERASAFFALGIAKATRAPAVAACTSGTAAANFLPAVVEAFQARVRLIALTADRPPRLRGTGANQTIDQVGLYGGYARTFTELPLPVEPVPEERIRSIVRSAFHEAIRPAGPIHLNLPFEDPLTPDGAEVAVDPSERHAVVFPDDFRRPIAEAEAVAHEVAGARAALIVGSMDDGPPTQLLELAQGLRWPVLAEPTSSARLPGLALAAGQASIADPSWIARHHPEVVLQIGATPTTRATQALVAATDRLVVIDLQHPEPDPERKAILRLREDPELIADELVGRSIEPSPEGWLEGWLEADAVARRVIDDLYESWDEPFEGRVARDLATGIPAGGTLVVGSSMPIRDLDYSMTPRDGLRVLANRGASGIDGFVSTVLGVAAAGTPTYALCGDLTFLHDAGSLMWSAGRGDDAVFVVVNNKGGAIFDFLPQRTLPEHERLLTTPHELDLGALCGAAGAGHARITRADELLPTVGRAAANGGVQVVEVPSDRALNVRRHAEVQAAVDAALA
jgi:2-succinyl-5-enolpyruvyl-6-hydroxy-3-cyclohexene-1-carboxylate synthase